MTTPTPTRGRRARRTRLIIALSAAVTVVLLGTAGFAAWKFGNALADDKPALSAETQMECTSISREFTAWEKDAPDLLSMVVASNPKAVVQFELKELKTNGDALLKAVSGYPDMPSKTLAVAVATYNFELGLVALEYQLTGGTFKEAQKQKAIDAAVAVENVYKAFSTATCSAST